LIRLERHDPEDHVVFTRALYALSKTERESRLSAFERREDVFLVKPGAARHWQP